MLSRFDAAGLLSDLVRLLEESRSGFLEKLDGKLAPEQIEFMEHMQDYSADARALPSRKSEKLEREDLREASEYGRVRTQHLAICAMMLGSGAESLSGDQKERLATLVLRLSAECFNIWLYWCSEDPPNKKFEAIVDRELKRLPTETKTELFLEAIELGKFLSNVISHTLPLIVSTSYVRTFARSPVLLPLIDRLGDGESAVQSLIKCLWEVIISPRVGGPRLVKLILSRGDLRRMRAAVKLYVGTLEMMSYSEADLDALRATARELAVRVPRVEPYPH